MDMKQGDYVRWDNGLIGRVVRETDKLMKIKGVHAVIIYDPNNNFTLSKEYYISMADMEILDPNIGRIIDDNI